MKRYLILSDGQSVHTLKWAKELIKYFNIYLISFNGFSKELNEIIPKENLFDELYETLSAYYNKEVLNNKKKSTHQAH